MKTKSRSSLTPSPEAPIEADRSRQVPTNQVTVVSIRAEPTGIITQITADTLHSAITTAQTNGYTRDLFALYRDVLATSSHLQAEFTKRKMAVLGDAMQVLPATPEPPAQDSALAIRSMIPACPNWLQAMSHLLDSTLYPCALLEKVFAPSGSGFLLQALVPVPHTLLTWQANHLQIFDTDAEGNVMGTAHDADPSRYIVHRGHLLSMPDQWGGPMRSLLFWWLLATMDREWWARYLDRFGGPFLVGRYDPNDDKARTLLQSAFSFAARLGGLVVTKDTEVEIHQAAASQSADAYEKFLAVCHREMSKLILGQTLSATSEPLGIGGGASGIHEAVRQDIRRCDGILLSQTLQQQLFSQYLAINRKPAILPRLAWGSDSAAEMEALAMTLKQIRDAGLEPTDAALPTISERLGISVQRSSSGPAFSGLALSAGDPVSIPPRTRRSTAALAQLIRRGYADLSQTMREDLSPVQDALLNSTSPGAALTRISAALLKPSPIPPALEETLVAASANGASAPLP